MSILPVGIGASGGYEISNSLRLRASASAYLNRTFGTPTNNKKWTLSGWVKRGTLSSASPEQYLLRAQDGVANGGVSFDSTDDLKITFGPTTYRRWSGVYRDPSAHLHIVLVFDSDNGTEANRGVLYVNGVLKTNSGGSIGSGLTTAANAANAHYIGGNGAGLDGYLSDVYFIDGQALTPSSFGETNSDGVWVPKAYTGTYGTNGFHLDFSDGTSATTLGYDAAGSNDWTPSGISTTAGVTYDWMTDTPSVNYAVLNPLTKPSSVTFSNANLTAALSTTSGHRSCGATFYFADGSWAWEVTADVVGNNSAGIGVANTSFVIGNEGGTDCYFYLSDGRKVLNNAYTAYGATYVATDRIRVEFNAATGVLEFFKQTGGTGSFVSQGQITGIPTGVTYVPFLCSNTSVTASTFSINFGQQPLAGTPTTGFKALCTANLPTVAIPNPSAHFNIKTYTGNASTQSITGLAFQPDLVWMKSRGRAVDHALFDAVRGVQKMLESNQTGAESTEATGLTAFNSDGWTMGALDQINGTTATNSFVGWAWKANGAGVTNTSGSITSTVSANTTAGFSIVTYTGTGANATVGHGLGVAPKMVIVKERSSGGDDWMVYHANLTSNQYYLGLNLTAAQGGPSASYWNSTSPTSSVFSIGTSLALNQNTSTYVAYCFAEIPGYSKFGSYVGNGSADGPFVHCGFRPRYILYKNISTGSTHWRIFDSARIPNNAADSELWANLSGAEANNSYYMDVLANGFKQRFADAAGGNNNASGETYIFAAFAEHPFGGSNVSPSPAR